MFNKVHNLPTRDNLAMGSQRDADVLTHEAAVVITTSLQDALYCYYKYAFIPVQLLCRLMSVL